jgi:hypothetical protein
VWDGWVYCEGVGSDYFESVQDLLDELYDPDDFPEFVWACKPRHFAKINLCHSFENMCDNAWETFEPDEDLKGIPELEAAVKRFEDLNHDVVSYSPDYTKAVLLSEYAKEYLMKRRISRNE